MCALAGLALPSVGQALTVQENPGDIKGVNTAISEIEDDLSQAHCGGWNYESEVVPKMAVVNGVPGHRYDPLGDIKSGMGIRIPGTPFEYPADADGFTSACRPGWPSFYEFFSCQRPRGEDGNPSIYKPDSKACDDPHPKIGPPGADTTEPATANCDTTDPLDHGVQWTCDALCEDLTRRWNYRQYSLQCDLDIVIPLPDPPGGTTTITVTFKGLTYANTSCWDLDVDDEPPDPEPLDPAAVLPYYNCVWNYYRSMQCCTNANVDLSAEATADGRTMAPPEEMNCRTCTGPDCQGQPPQTGPEPGPAPYYSYFREYDASCFMPEAVPGVPDDDRTRPSIPVACYGFYGVQFTGADYDPMLVVSEWYQQNCVIATSYESNHLWDMKDSQKNDWSLDDQVEYGKKSKDDNIWPDLPDSRVPEDYHIIRNPTYTNDDDLWYPNLGGGFSLLNGKVFEDDFGSDLSFALLTPDTSEHRAYPQLTLENLYSSGAYLRAMDDTVTSLRPQRRTLVEWWQELETEAHNLFNTPQVRLQLPPTWSVGLDPLDPLFTPDIPDPEDPTDPILAEDRDNPRDQPIEVMLEAREDLLGEVAAYMERSLVLRVLEEPVPVVVPFGDPLEYRSIAQAWCSWEMERDKTEKCDGTVAPLVERLEEYADRMDDIRILRGELATYEALLLVQQNELISTIGNWLNNSLQQYISFQNSISALEQLRFRWQQIQLRYRKFHDKTNLPWCMNMRFLPPIFSLLDDGGGTPWLPGRPLLDGGIDGAVEGLNPLTLPRFSVSRLGDVVLDFSMIRTATGAIRLPVLKPIQVRLSPFLLTVPSTKADPRIIDDILEKLPPALPPIPTIADGITAADFPDVLVENPPPDLTSYFPGTAPLVDAAVFDRIEDLVFLMDYSYGRFWKSVKIDPETVDPKGTEKDCVSVYLDTCVHVEMDLLSRLERICARPGVTLKEDFESYGQKRAPEYNDVDYCPREDWACLLQRPFTYEPQHGWAIRTPADTLQDDLINNLRVDMFEENLLREGVADEDLQKFIVTPNEMTPAFEVRPTINLLPVHSSSSSSSSS
ncbi:MAG: hypothetical protein O2904_01860 [bacterium]|nr:hypothetical protein [bacterium]